MRSFRDSKTAMNWALALTGGPVVTSCGLQFARKPLFRNGLKVLPLTAKYLISLRTG
jgi:hypothetical protein